MPRLIAASGGLVLFAAAAGCSSDAAAKPPIEASDDFPAFAELLNQRLQNGDVDFLVDRMLTQHAVCTEEDLDRQVGRRYDCNEAGEEYDGFQYGIWATDCCPLLRHADVEEILRVSFSRVRPGAGDNLGNGQFTV